VEVLRAGDGNAKPFGKASQVPLRRGDLVRLVTGTGGGYGNPREREPLLVLEDLHDEIITGQEATEVYGVPAIGADR
jgi:N-methylhydantoinase B